jgi:hypothetical protein
VDFSPPASLVLKLIEVFTTLLHPSLMVLRIVGFNSTVIVIPNTVGLSPSSVALSKK